MDGSQIDSKRMREYAERLSSVSFACTVGESNGIRDSALNDIKRLLTACADALDGLTVEDVAAMREREDAGSAAMSEYGNYDELCRQDKARLLAVVEKLMGVK